MRPVPLFIKKSGNEGGLYAVGTGEYHHYHQYWKYKGGAGIRAVYNRLLFLYTNVQGTAYERHHMLLQGHAGVYFFIYSGRYDDSEKFFKKLVNDGVEVTIETNGEYYD